LFSTEPLGKDLLYTKKEYFIPLFGLVGLGNFLILFNFVLPISSNILRVIIISLVLTSIYLYFKNFKFKFKFNFSFFVDYILIPSILLVSTVNINFHYDAGYYHLLHQSWLRETNLILGMSNIFFAFGMSSIYEYISAFLWTKKSLIYLHFLNIYFIHFFYLFLKCHILRKNNNFLFATSFFVLTFSILDNFGFDGGRNGYLFIQGVGKQDISVGILFFIVTTLSFVMLKNNHKLDINYVYLSLISFFIFEIKVSGVMVFLLLISNLFKLKFFDQENFKKILIFNIPVVLLSILWFSKSILNTSCIIYPLELTCFNFFDWYIEDSVVEVEYYTKASSGAYDFQLPFLNWIQRILISGNEYRDVILKNFGLSVCLILFLKKLFFKKNNTPTEYKLLGTIFLIINVLYLIFFGPIPRYAVGAFLIFFTTVALFTGESKIKLNRSISIVLILFSIASLVNLSSYKSLLTQENILLIDPRIDNKINQEIGYVKSFTNWVKPSKGDQCWVRIDCSMSNEDIYFENTSFFKKAYRVQK